MAKKPLTERLKTFEDVCKETQRNVADYAISKKASAKKRVSIRMDRIKLIAKAFNGKEKIRLADTSQWKHYPCFWVIEDKDAPGGLRLSFFVSGVDRGSSFLGVRPYYVREEDSTYAGQQFLGEYEALLQDEALALLED